MKNLDKREQLVEIREKIYKKIDETNYSDEEINKIHDTIWNYIANVASLVSNVNEQCFEKWWKYINEYYKWNISINDIKKLKDRESKELDKLINELINDLNNQELKNKIKEIYLKITL